MARENTFRIILAAMLFAGACLPARALQLGEARAHILARHGAPGTEDRARNAAIYSWDGWSADLEFKNDVVQKLIFRRNTYLTEVEITSLLTSNGGLNRWHETAATDEPTREWTRDDGATATCLAVRPLIITFQKAERPATRYVAEARPQNVVPAATPAVSATPPNFPKLLGSTVPSSSEEPESPRTLPTGPTVAGSLPKLPSEEVPTEPAASVANQKPAFQLPAADIDPADPAEERETAPATAATEAPSGRFGWIIGLFALLGAGSGGFYWWKHKSSRSGHVESSPIWVPTPRGEPGATFKATTPAFDALRGDQYDLVVGEIFRRAGYTVELSAATGQGDTIDLTLRRDSETILVQCKHWKTSRVGEQEIREFHGLMMANGAPRGIFVTAGSFSREAQEFAKGKDIELMDRTALEESAGAVARPGEEFCGISGWIEEFTANARIFDPECPICQGTMVIRPHRANGAAAWNCRNHPRCPGRREPRLDLLAAGAVH